MILQKTKVNLISIHAIAYTENILRFNENNDAKDCKIISATPAEDILL
jgi:hypothetical protein